MGATGWNLPEFTIRAMRALARGSGQPVSGKCSATAYTTADATAALEADGLYQLTSSTDAWVGMADATQAGNRMYLKAWQPYYMLTGSAATLHFCQVSSGGNMYVAKLDDVG